VLAGSVEGFPSHARIGEDLIGFLGLDNNLLRLGRARQHRNEGECNGKQSHRWSSQVHCVVLFHARTYSTLNVEGKSLSSGIPTV
jgi:hypothetical protein